MNERIEELAEQSWVSITDGNAKVVDPYKFAELIVRECANVVFKNTGPKSALNVLEHFGLKDEE